MNQKQINILMVEDDTHFGYLLKENLESKGYSIHLCADGQEGLEAFTNNTFDICILDVMMPRKDGFTLAKSIRNINDVVPIVFLTAKTLEEDKIKGFMIGADDYITKPFSVKELLLRINAILKRTKLAVASNSNSSLKAYNIGKYKFDYKNRTLTILDDETSKKLNSKEAELLKILYDHRNTIINRSIILKTIWGSDDFFISKSMDVYLTRLRKLLKEDTHIKIENLYGTGFKLIIDE